MYRELFHTLDERGGDYDLGLDRLAALMLTIDARVGDDELGTMKLIPF